MAESTVTSTDHPSEASLPSLRELGLDLLKISRLQRIATLVLPFLTVAAYFFFALRGWWVPAVMAVIYLSFITYGSTSHDLVHRTLGLPRPINELFLCLIELLTLRSGHAYRLVHLHHHAVFPREGDIEGAAADMSFWRAVLDGPTLQIRIWWWAIKSDRRQTPWIMFEIVACIALLCGALIAVPRTPVFLIYTLLAIMGSWVFPLITSYIPHNPHGKNELFQTRAFRGVVASTIAMEHLYHLEHHLYPAVPHHNWKRLARRLDPYFEKAGIRPIKLWF